ncbi:myocardin-related transcription factor B isoform X6 [Sagmatias obliquidens]|uniref:myocardin-related transcription factor B isoform X6 n=1 Tax=Sagmatias obliquidens TaxID=3371155 RepID=UPI000F446261|nr:myocardin-related transcription factor B isoform X6 [Lagenorhynchus obliquidens]
MSLQQATVKRRLVPSAAGGWDTMDHTGAVDTEDELGPLAHLAPSPQSEAVAHEFQELSLQSSQHLPPLNERKNVLQLRLQQRRTREQLVDQGIMPPLKSPAAFHEQIKSLERARTENFLKHKIRSRPDRSELVRMHILEETFAEPSLQATQMKLKRARLADDLNEKIAQRPGPMELVEKNILPVDSSVKEAIIGVGKEDYPQTQGDFSFDEDSSDALSPDQPASQESQGSAASPSEPKVSESPSPVTTNTPAQFTSVSPAVPEFLKTPTADQPPTRSTAPVLSTNTVSSAKPGPALVKQSHPKNPNDKHRSKKCKDPKPRVKKLKYHQYIPPDQKGEKSEPPMDSNYARLLQQQQLFLQLQILSQQQQQHYNYQTILPAPLKPLNDKNNNSGNPALNTTTSNTPRQNTSAPMRKPGPLPSSLDDLKTPPQTGIQAQTQIATATLSSGLAQAAPQKQDTFTPHVLSQPQQVRKVFTNSASNTGLPYQRPPAPAVQQPFINKTNSSILQPRSTPLPSLQNGPNPPNKPGSPPPPQQFAVQHSLFGSPVPKTKDPPRYEEAIKQTRSAQSSLPEISNAHSQQMDDLFDILIKSGEISLPIKEEPSPISKMRPVTASITTMPVSTVVSRPPPQVQMAPPISLEPMSSLSASLENQLEAFLDGTLPSASEIAPLQSSSEDREPFSLIEDLQNDLLSHSGVLDHSHSPMETSEAQFAASTPCLSLDLSDSNLDNMEWLDITMPGTSSGLTPLSATAPSMFSADFLDPQDLPLPWD